MPPFVFLLLLIQISFVYFFRCHCCWCSIITDEMLNYYQNWWIIAASLYAVSNSKKMVRVAQGPARTRHNVRICQGDTQLLLFPTYHTSHQQQPNVLLLYLSLFFFVQLNVLSFYFFLFIEPNNLSLFPYCVQQIIK